MTSINKVNYCYTTENHAALNKRRDFSIYKKEAIFSMCFFANKFKLLFRATMFPFWKYDNEKETLSELVNSQPIYLASPNLYQKHTNALADNQSIGKDLKHSLTRYHLRMCTRSTPFGFFAGCGVTGWNDQTRVNTQHAQYHTRLDHLVLHQLAQQIFSVPAIQAQLRYFPNNSRYTVHDELALRGVYTYRPEAGL